MKIYNEIVFNVDGNVTYEDSYEYTGDVMLMQQGCEAECAEAYSHSNYAGDLCIEQCSPEENNGTGNCVSQGKVECYDGSCADTLDQCSLPYEFDQDVGYTPEGKFIDDPSTPNKDEALEYIYEQLGGQDWMNITYDQFAAEYSEYFPTWKDSQYEKQSELIESKLALVPHAMELKDQAFTLQEDKARFTATSELEGIGDQREAMHRASGGLQSGQRESKIDSVYDKVLKGFDFTQDAIDLERESSLIDFSTKILDYEFDLSQIVSDYQNRMWDLVANSKDMFKDISLNSSLTCPEGQHPAIQQHINQEVCVDDDYNDGDGDDEGYDQGREDYDQGDRDEDRDDEYDDRDYWDGNEGWS